MDSVEDKQFFANARLEKLKNEIDRLPNLYNNGTNIDGASWEEEAIILCIVYLDRFSNLIKLSGEHSHTKFCELLIEHGGNDCFGLISLRQLFKNFKAKKYKNELQNVLLNNIADKVINYLNSIHFNLNGDSVYEKSALISFLPLDSILSQNECKKLKSELWRGSIASICYQDVRCITIHRGTQNCLNIGEIQVNFDLLYPALLAVYHYIEKEYRTNGIFFGYNEGEHFFSYTPDKDPPLKEQD